MRSLGHSAEQQANAEADSKTVGATGEVVLVVVGNCDSTVKKEQSGYYFCFGLASTAWVVVEVQIRLSWLHLLQSVYRTSRAFGAASSLLVTIYISTNKLPTRRRLVIGLASTLPVTRMWSPCTRFVSRQARPSIRLPNIHEVTDRPTPHSTSLLYTGRSLIHVVSCELLLKQNEAIHERDPC